MKFEHLFSPMQVGKVTYRNRIVSAPMAFGLIVQNPDARDFTYRKLEASAKGGNGCVIVGETDVNFTDAVRIPGFRPFDFAKPEEDPETFDAVGEYARRIKRHGAVALAELVHCGKEKVPFGPGQEAIGPIETTNLAGVRVRPMNEDDMARIARDFAVSATYMQKAGFDGVLIHGGHGFLFTQFLSPLMNTRTDSYGGSLENRARFPLQILKAVREAVGPDFLVELRIDGTDHQPGGITPEETGAFVAMAEPYITSVHVTCGIYEASVKSGTESSMFHPHGLNIDNAAIIKKYTKLPVGAVGGINSPELCEQAIAEGKIDFAILGRQMLADPEFANKAKSGHEDQIRRCLRCYKCFPGSPEEGYDDLPFTSEELALYVGHCTINPLAHLPFDPDTLAPASKQETVLIVGGGAAGMQAAITACDRGQKVILAEQGPRLGGLLVDGVGLHGDEGKHQAGTGGHHGQQEQGEAARHGPEFQSWNTGQIHQAQEIKVDGENPAAHLAHSGLDRLQVFRGDQGGQVKLVIAHIGESFAGLLDPAVAHRNGVPVHHLGNLVEYLHIVDAHHILNGLADDGVQGNQNQQREKRPQAAAHGVDLLPLIKLLDLQIIALTVSAVLLLQLLHLALKHVHLNHAPLTLQRKREQDKLDNDRE